MELINPEHCFYAYPCSRFLLVNFYLGTCVALIGRRALYLLVAWAIGFVVLHFVLDSGLQLANSIFQAILGAAFGLWLRIILRQRVVLTPMHALKRHRSIFIINCHYLVGGLAFIPASLAVPENGVPYGVYLTLILFWIWIAFVYFANQRKIRRAEKGPSEFTDFTRAVSALALGISSVLLVAAVPMFNDYVASSAGFLAGAGVCWFTFKNRVPIKTG